MDLNIRKSQPGDFDFLEKLENESFPQFQQSSRKSIKHSLDSTFQEVLIVESKEGKRQLLLGRSHCLNINMHSEFIRLLLWQNTEM